MKISSTILFNILTFILCFSCQKLNLQKDGYFTLKADGSRESFDYCEYEVIQDTIDSTPLKRNYIYASNSKENIISDFKVLIIFTGETKGTYNTCENIMVPSLYANIVYKGEHFEAFGTLPFPYDKSNMVLTIDKYDLNKGIIDGSISGKFCNYNNNETIELKKCNFRAMDPNKY